MRNQISTNKIGLNNKTDVECLKEITKLVISESEQLVYESYDEEPTSGAHFYDNDHLGYLENLLDDICDILMSSVTYKPHLKLIAQIKSDLYFGDTDRFQPQLVGSVINNVAFVYFKKDQKVLDRNDDNCQYHYSYIVRKLRPMSNKLAKIIAENEIEDVFNHRGW